MTRPHRRLSFLTLSLPCAAFILAVSPPSDVMAQGLPADYARAQAIYTSRDSLVDLAIGFPDRPHWIEGTHTFWYKVSTEGGYRIVSVDADAAEKSAAFDHARLAASLSDATGESYTAVTLPYDSFRVLGALEAVEFRIEGRTWRCSLSDYRFEQVGEESGLSEPSASDPQPEGALSPDGRWEALVRDHNVAIRRVGSSEIRALSTDGSDSDGYEHETFNWSPDSRKLAAYRVRPAVRRLDHYVEAFPDDQLQPRYFSRVAGQNPGDVIEVETPVLFDIQTGGQVIVDRSLFPNALEQSELQWWEDSRAFHFEYYERGAEVYRIIEVDGTTGVARALLDEQPETFFSAPSRYRYDTENGEEIIWASTRDGWKHLYLLDGRTGAVKTQITQGKWAVWDVDYVDEVNRQIWFTAGGMYADQDPYLDHFFRVGFDGSGLTAFTEANGIHTVTWSPDREYYVDTWSRVDAPPVSMLRRTSDQSVVLELERGDISALTARGWVAPEPFVAKGRDGVTDIWGMIVRPSNFDPSRSYPVIEYIYTGTRPEVDKTFEIHYPWPGQSGGGDLRIGNAHRLNMALAELGFIVVQIDGMGHEGRSRTFREVRWRNVKDDGYPDRIPWHQAVAERYPYYDITRVGLIGSSAGGRAAVGGMLFYPEFYDVAVAVNGNHDLRLSSIRFEQALGWPVGPLYAENSNVENAWRLRGNLLLGVSELDTILHPASTFRLAAALMDAHKDFDLVVIFGADHSEGAWSATDRRMFFHHKVWDFFVKHLLGIEPPDWNAIEVGEGR
ncbi:DPP IV N-terminal domain-containing protein [Gemmatimonadota bacterium]